MSSCIHSHRHSFFQFDRPQTKSLHDLSLFLPLAHPFIFNHHLTVIFIVSRKQCLPTAILSPHQSLLSNSNRAQQLPISSHSIDVNFCTCSSHPPSFLPITTKITKSVHACYAASILTARVIHSSN